MIYKWRSEHFCFAYILINLKKHSLCGFYTYIHKGEKNVSVSFEFCRSSKRQAVLVNSSKAIHTQLCWG